MRKALQAALIALLALPLIVIAETTASVTARVIPIDEVKRGALVTVKGKVERVLDTDEFRLADESGHIAVCVGYRHPLPVRQGDVVTVTGFVDDDVFVEIYAGEIVHANGQVTQLNNQG